MMSFNMSKIHKIIDIIGQFVAPNRRAIEDRSKFYLGQLLIFFSNRVYKNWRHFFVSVARNSGAT